MEGDKVLDTAMLHLKAEMNKEGFSESTISRYISHNKAFLNFINKGPQYVRKGDIKTYTRYLFSDTDIPRITVKEIFASLMFLYDNVLKKGFCLEQPSERFELLTQEEIKQMLSYVKSIKHKVFIKLMYATEMKLSECISLKTKDIDIRKKKIIIGNKEYNIPDSLITDIVKYLDTKKGEKYFFNDNNGSHISAKVAQTYLDAATADAGMDRVYFPILKRSFARHLAEAGGARSKAYYHMVHQTSLHPTSKFLSRELPRIDEHPADLL